MDRSIYLSISLYLYLSILSYLTLPYLIFSYLILSFLSSLSFLPFLSFLSIFLIYLSINLSIYPSIYLSTYLPIYLSSYLSIDRSIYRSIDLSIYLQVCRRSYFAIRPQFLNLTTSKTQQFSETSSILVFDNVKNEAILRDFLNCSKLTTSKTKQFCKASFKTGKLSAELTASYQCVLRFFDSTCLNYCACHEKVIPGHTKCCTCHAKSSQQT